MAKNTAPQVDGFVVNAQSDIPDIRDWPYQPALVQLRDRIKPPANPHILNQGREGACTGFGLAAVINLLNRQRKYPILVSPRMLYEMAKKYDEWEGENYSGSSCRGAIKGWYNMGVCEDKYWPYRGNRPGSLTLDAVREARKNTIGAYYRINHRISDFHAALNEVEAIYVSANVHDGWQIQYIRNGVIPHKKQRIGGHAFAIVGYDDRGFWVQNSWGRGWGTDGLALWLYEDWQENVKDAWVLRLALPTPQVWPPSASQQEGRAEFNFKSGAPNRAEIAGHFVHIDDGNFHDNGKYWSTPGDVSITANYLANDNHTFKHLLLYAHGGLNSTEDSAKRISAMKAVFLANDIYPYHFMYDTGLTEELKDIIIGKRKHLDERVTGFTDATDWLIEKATRQAGRALWREMKRGARTPFNNNKAGAEVLTRIFSALNSGRSKLKIHLVGHSTGGILMAYLLRRLATMSKVPRISTVHLLAPACSIDLFNDEYSPLIKATSTKFGIDNMQVLNLNEALELEDNVAKVYRKSLLYLVSRAFEEKKETPILGMQLYSKGIPVPQRLEFVYSEGTNGGEKRTRSEKHGGFDNDVSTMNSILRNVLGKKPRREFREEDLDY